MFTDVLKDGGQYRQAIFVRISFLFVLDVILLRNWCNTIKATNTPKQRCQTLFKLFLCNFFYLFWYNFIAIDNSQKLDKASKKLTERFSITCIWLFLYIYFGISCIINMASDNQQKWSKLPKDLLIDGQQYSEGYLSFVDFYMLLM